MIYDEFNVSTSHQFTRLSDCELRLSSGNSDKLNLGAIVGAFQIAKETAFEEQKRAEKQKLLIK